MTNLTDSTQKALVASSVEIGFLLAIFSFGIFIRIFNSIVEEKGFLIPYISILIGATVVSIIFIRFLPYGDIHAKGMIWGITISIASYFYWFLWDMPEVDANLNNYGFDSWNPFTVGGNVIFLAIFLVLNVFNLFWQFALLRQVYHAKLLGQDRVDSVPALIRTGSSSRHSQLDLLIAAVFLCIFSFLGLVLNTTPKFYLLLNIAWLFIEIIVLISFGFFGQKLKKTEEHPNAASDHLQKGNKSVLPGRFNTFIGIFLISAVLMVVYPNQINNASNLPTLANILPMTFLGLASGWGLTWVLDRIGFNGHMMKYWILWGGFIILWVILLSTSSFADMGTLGVQYLIGILLGLILSLLWNYYWPFVSIQNRRGRDILQIFWIVMILIISHILIVEFENNGWDIFLYVAIGVIILSLITGIITSIRIKHKFQ